MTACPLPVNAERLWGDVMSLAAITDPDLPYTRRAFSPKFLEGRAWLADRFRQAGLEVRVDAAGNLIGRRPGTGGGGKTIVIGSHSDTVPGGGRFDGVAGVCAGLEIARALAERGERLAHDLEVVDCLAEEMTAYRLSCVGSRGMTGQLTSGMMAYRAPDGEPLGVALGRVGGDRGRLSDAVRHDIAAFLELHIEQGRVLEEDRIAIGVVHTIVGITRIELTVEGRADHAGTTPMDRRMDALCGAAAIVTAVRDKAGALASSGGGYFVATTGELHVEPNAANVVPRRARLVIDARAERRQTLQGFLDWIAAHLPAVAAGQQVRLLEPVVLSDSALASCDTRLCGLAEDAAAALGLSSRRMASGAGHDAAFFSRIAPTALVFVPCRDGRSHTPEEWAEPEALARGAAVVLKMVAGIDRGAERGERV